MKSFASDANQWVIFMLSASGAEEPIHPTQFHFVHNVQTKIDEQPTTTLHEDQFLQLFQHLSDMLNQEFTLESDLDECYKPVGRNNISYRIGAGKECNAFTLRTAFSVTVWDDRHIAILRLMADVINQNIGTGGAIQEDKSWKENGFGY